MLPGFDAVKKKIGEAAEAMEPAKGTGKTKFHEGNSFEVDTNGCLMVTASIIETELVWAYHGHLKKAGRDAEMTEVKKIMANLDTGFYKISQSAAKSEKFVDARNWFANGPWTAEQVNYIGVGMGFNYFDVFDHKLSNAKLFTEMWNTVKYNHGATDGEHYWTAVGFYWDVSLFDTPEASAKKYDTPQSKRPPLP